MGSEREKERGREREKERGRDEDCATLDEAETKWEREV